MSKVTVQIRARRSEKDYEDDSWFYSCEIRNETNETISGGKLSVAIIDPKHEDTFLDEESIDMDPIEAFDTVSFDYRSDYARIKRKVRAQVDDEVYDFIVSPHYTDSIINNKRVKSESRFLAFLRRHVVAFAFAAIAALSYFLLPAIVGTDFLNSEINGIPLSLLYLEVMWLLFGVPVVLYIGWLFSIGAIVREVASTRVSGTVSNGGLINVTVSEGSPSGAEDIRKSSGVGRVRTHRRVFFWGFTLNILIITYLILHRVSPNYFGDFSALVQACSFPYIFHDSYKVLFGLKPVITTQYPNLNLIIACLEYAVVLVVPFVLLALTKKLYLLHKTLVSVFWGTVLGLLVIQAPFAISFSSEWLFRSGSSKTHAIETGPKILLTAPPATAAASKKPQEKSAAQPSDDKSIREHITLFYNKEKKSEFLTFEGKNKNGGKFLYSYEIKNYESADQLFKDKQDLKLYKMMKTDPKYKKGWLFEYFRNSDGTYKSVSRP